MDMTPEEHSDIWNNAIYRNELRREDALDCFHSIITMVEKYFVRDNIKFVSWMHVNFEILRNNFDFATLLEKIIVIQEYIKDKSFLNECAFFSIHETIQTICEL
jgi:hypothetical protein